MPMILDMVNDLSLPQFFFYRITNAISFTVAYSLIMVMVVIYIYIYIYIYIGIISLSYYSCYFFVIHVYSIVYTINYILYG